MRVAGARKLSALIAATASSFAIMLLNAEYRRPRDCNNQQGD
jgi:hypothetical protein